jgi:steroid delta-isomerase-like uncharacterized protein
MSIDQNKAIVHRWMEEFWNKGNVDVASELLHPNYVPSWEQHEPGHASLEAIKEANLFWRRVFPDLHFALDEVIGEGDTVVARWTSHGTHQGDWETPLGTVPASGKVTSTSGTNTFHLQDGKIIEDLYHIDFMTTLQQMGATIQPGEPGH